MTTKHNKIQQDPTKHTPCEISQNVSFVAVCDKIDSCEKTQQPLFYSSQSAILMIIVHVTPCGQLRRQINQL